VITMPEHHRERDAEDLEELEDVPMCRYSNPIPTCDRRGDSRGSYAEQLDQIQSALACQTQLLVDLLAAVNGLTAAVLTREA
jgi:hypothetical protein